MLFESSAKFLDLKKVLPELHVKKSRVLIFSQFKMTLDILELFLQELNYKYLRFDGSTAINERQDLIDKFNNNSSYFVFLLTTGAGGVGINLTSADTVIFYDLSYNPQNDRQAEDRCHRLGQTKTVKVYKLLVEDTVDIHIHKIANDKKILTDMMLEEGNFEGKEKESITKLLTNCLSTKIK